MQAKDLLLNEGSERQKVKEVSEELPDIGVAIFPEALVIETINLCDLTAFVISAGRRVSERKKRQGGKWTTKKIIVDKRRVNNKNDKQ